MAFITALASVAGRGVAGVAAGLVAGVALALVAAFVDCVGGGAAAAGVAAAALSWWRRGVRGGIAFRFSVAASVFGVGVWRHHFVA